MRLVMGLLAAALVLLAACDKQDAPVELRVGAQKIFVVIPKDWEHFDYGDRHHIRKGFARIVIEDLSYSGRDLGKAAERALVKFREDERRETATSVEFLLDGRDALAIDTWDLFSHEYRKSYVFVEDWGDLLVIYMMQGTFETMEEAFGEIITSFAFVDSLAATAAPFPGGEE